MKCYYRRCRFDFSSLTRNRHRYWHYYYYLLICFDPTRISHRRGGRRRENLEFYLHGETKDFHLEKEKFLTTWNVIITARFARFLLHLRFSLSTLVNQQLPRHSRYTPLLVYEDNRPRSRIERTPWKEEAILLRGSDCLPAWSKKIRSPSQILFVSRPMIVNRNIGAPWIGSFDRRRSPWIGSIRLSPHEIHPSPRELSFQLNREKDSFDKEFAKWARCFLVAPLFACDNTVQVWWNLSIQISL